MCLGIPGRIVAISDAERAKGVHHAAAMQSVGWPRAAGAARRLMVASEGACAAYYQYGDWEGRRDRRAADAA